MDFEGEERGERRGDVVGLAFFPLFLELLGDSGGDCEPNEEGEEALPEWGIREGSPTDPVAREATWALARRRRGALASGSLQRPSLRRES